MDRKTKIARAFVKGIRQETQYTCMATSLASCIKAWGKDVTEADVNKVMGAGPLRGARWEEALATAQYFGMRGTLVVPATLDMLRDWTRRGVPVMIAWNPENRPWSHASVVVDVDDEDMVHIMDPNIPDPDETFRIVHKSEFYKVWGEPAGDSMIIRRPALAIEREVSPEGRQLPMTAVKTAAGKKERQRSKDRSRSRRMQHPELTGPEVELTDAQKSQKGVERQRAIEEGTYWSNRGGPHPDKSKYDRKQKHRKDWNREANIIRLAVIQALQRDMRGSNE